MRNTADYLRALAILLLVAAGCFLLRSRLNPTDVAMVLLLADVFVATRYRQGPALLTALFSIVIFDFVFVPPYYTLNVHDTAYFLTFGVMLGVVPGPPRRVVVVEGDACGPGRSSQNSTKRGNSSPSDAAVSTAFCICCWVKLAVAMSTATSLPSSVPM